MTRIQLLVFDSRLLNLVKCDESIINLFHPCLVHGKTNQRFGSLHIIWDEVWCRKVNPAIKNIFIHLQNLFYFMWSNKQWFSWKFFTYMNIFAHPILCLPLFTFQITFQLLSLPVCIFMAIFLLLLVDFTWMEIYFAKNWSYNIAHCSTSFFVAFLIWVVWEDSASFLGLLHEIFTASTLSSCTYFWPWGLFKYLPDSAALLKSPFLNFNHLVSVFGVVSAHWCWTLWSLLLNSCYYYYNYYYCYHRLCVMVGRVASLSKCSTSGIWNSPLRMKSFQIPKSCFSKSCPVLHWGILQVSIWFDLQLLLLC